MEFVNVCMVRYNCSYFLRHHRLSCKLSVMTILLIYWKRKWFATIKIATCGNFVCGTIGQVGLISYLCVQISWLIWVRCVSFLYHLNWWLIFRFHLLAPVETFADHHSRHSHLHHVEDQQPTLSWTTVYVHFCSDNRNRLYHSFHWSIDSIWISAQTNHSFLLQFAQSIHCQCKCSEFFPCSELGRVQSLKSGLNSPLIVYVQGFSVPLANLFPP